MNQFKWSDTLLFIGKAVRVIGNQIIRICLFTLMIFGILQMATKDPILADILQKMDSLSILFAIAISMVSFLLITVMDMISDMMQLSQKGERYLIKRIKKAGER